MALASCQLIDVFEAILDNPRAEGHFFFFFFNGTCFSVSLVPLIMPVIGQIPCYPQSRKCVGMMPEELRPDQR